MGSICCAEDRLKPTKRLNSGFEMPIVGLGTFKSAKGEVGGAVTAAVEAGYRLIDCAAGYGNEAEVGVALKELMDKGTVERKDLFIVSKIFQTHHAWHGDPSRVKEQFEQTLKDLQLDYLDMLLIHWPFAFDPATYPKSTPYRDAAGLPNPLLDIEVEYIDTWKVLESFVSEKRVRSIGVSNFTEAQLDHLRANCSIPPAVNQVEVHPYLSQVRMKEYCDKNGILLMAYSPLGSAAADFPEKHGSTLLAHKTINHIASDVGKAASQVLVRWSIQRGVVSIPKSKNPERIKENGDVLTWELPEDAMKKIDELNCDFRYFSSWSKKPSNDHMWHDGAVFEHNQKVS